MVEVPGLGLLTVDVAYGGMIYVIVSAEALGFTLAREEARALVETGERIKIAAAEQLPSIHPENPGIHTINQTLFAGPLHERDGVKAAKNAVVVSPGRIDRSPCGTGSSARSEEHTSELQSLMRISYAVFCLNNKTTHTTTH